LGEHGGAWQRAISKIARGERPAYRFIRLGRTNNALRQLGLGPGDLVMSAAKVVRAMREHPEVSLSTWHRLPALIDAAIAGFPSARRDGSVIVVLIERDNADDPIVVPILWDGQQKLNIILSVYGRSPHERLTGDQWIQAQLQAAKSSGEPYFEKMDLVDAEPKPKPASPMDATSWSPGSIPEDRPTRPKKDILSLRQKSKENEEN